MTAAEKLLIPERVANLERAVRLGHLAIGVDKRSMRNRETLLALIEDWQRLRRQVDDATALMKLEESVRLKEYREASRADALPPSDPRKPYR